MSGIIAISGKSGCGNSTVTKLVAQGLGWSVVNYTFKDLARKLGMSFEAVMEASRYDFSYDRQVDQTQVEMARQGERVVGSRLAIWLLREEADLRVYLWASPEVRAARIIEREGKGRVSDPAFTKARDASDHERYLQLYGYDNDNYEGVDLVFNTERFSPEAMAALIIEAYRARDTARD